MLALKKAAMYRLALPFLIALQLLASLPAAHAAENPPLELAAAFALTGVGASFGAVELNGVTLALEEANAAGGIGGRTIKLVVEDTQSSNVGTLNAVRKLMALNRAKVILGPTWLDSYQSVLPVADKEQTLLFTPSAAALVFKKGAEQYPLVFSTWFNLEKEIVFLLRHIESLRKRSIALAFDQDPFCQTIRSLVKRDAPQHRLAIGVDASFDLQTADFRATLTRIVSSQTEGVVLCFGDEGNLVSFLRQRRDLAPAIPLFGTDYLDGYAAQEQYRPLMNNLAYVATHVPDTSFREKYRKRFNAEPILSASTAYDAANILLDAFRHGKFEPREIRDYFTSNSFATVTFGAVRFNELEGVDASEFTIVTTEPSQVSRSAA